MAVNCGRTSRYVMSALLVMSMLIYPVLSAKFLLIAPSMDFSSHRLEVVTIGEELARRGHDVYVTTASMTPNANRLSHPPPNKDNISITELQYRVTESDIAVIKRIQRDVFSNVKTTRKNIMFLMERLMTMMCEDARFALEDENFLKHARQLKFDYALIDRFFVGPCFFLIAQAINVPYFSTGSPFDFWLGGLPTVPSVYLSCVPLDIDEGLHLFSYRLWHSIFLVFTETLTALGHHPASKYDALLQKHAPTANTWQKVIAQSLVSFVTRELTLDNVQPRMPNVVTVPSVTFSDPTGVLPPELNTLMTSEPANQHGVIVVSFGSMAKHLPLDIIENLAAAFAMLPNHVFVWNLKGISYDVTIPRNVHVLAWLPQNELLAHRNTKLFITHCGNNGYYESVYHRVPMVALPMWGDQPPNARLMQKKGFGITLDIGTFTSDELVQAIERVLSDVSYRQNVTKASAILRDSAMTPRQTVAYWIEHVIKYGHEHLRSHAMDLAWYEYFMIDVFAFLTAIMVVLLVGLWLTVKILWSFAKQLLCGRARK